MKPYDYPSWFPEIGGTSACPELAEAIEAGEYVQGENWSSATAQHCTYGQVEDIGRYRFPGKREAYVYRLQSCRTPSGEVWWHTYGEYCWAGRSPSDADYEFLDGGGYFKNRTCALWAVHIWLSHLHRSEALRLNLVPQTLSHGF